MELVLSAFNPATGTELSPVLIWAVIGSAVILAGCIIFAVISSKKKKNKGKRKNRRR